MLGLKQAAVRAGVSVRTLRRWKAEGMATVRVDGEILVSFEAVKAWKRYKGLMDPAREYRRREAGVTISEQSRAWVVSEFVKFGGRPGR